MDEKEEELKIHNPKGFEPSPGYTASMALSLTQVPIALRYQQCVITEFISVAPSIIRTWDWPCQCSSSSWIPLCQWHLHLFCKEVRIAHKNGHLGPKHTIDWLSATRSSSKVNVYRRRPASQTGQNDQKTNDWNNYNEDSDYNAKES